MKTRCWAALAAMLTIGAAAEERLVVHPARISCAPGVSVPLQIVRLRSGVTTPTPPGDYWIGLRPAKGASVILRKRITDGGQAVEVWCFRAMTAGNYLLTVRHRGGGKVVVRAEVSPTIPIHAITALRVEGFRLTRLDGPVTLKPGDRVAFAAEARDARGMTLSIRPRWELVEPYAGALSVNPYSGVCTLTAGRYPSHSRLGYRLRVYDPRVPAVQAVVRLRIVGPVEQGGVALPQRLEAYLVEGRRRRLIGKGMGLFARPGQVSRVEILGVFGQKRRPVRVTWSLADGAGTVLQTGLSSARLIAGYTESRPKHPYRLRIYHHRDHRIRLILPLVIER